MKRRHQFHRAIECRFTYSSRTYWSRRISHVCRMGSSPAHKAMGRFFRRREAFPSHSGEDLMTSHDRIRLSRRAALQSAIAVAAIPAVASAQDATPVASPVASPVPASGQSSEWFSYGHDLTGSKATTDGLITTANVASLAPIWSFPVQGPVSSTPVIVNGVAYVGSYDGNLYAIDIVTGASIWTYASGADVTEP